MKSPSLTLVIQTGLVSYINEISYGSKTYKAAKPQSKLIQTIVNGPYKAQKAILIL